MAKGTQPHHPPHEDDLEDRVAALLADPDYADHPLRRLVEDLMERMASHVTKLERITQISDRYQSGVQERFRSLSSRYDRQINRLEKAIRISDRYQSMLNDLNRALQEASTHDQLTGLPNRKLMADGCRRQDQRVKRDGITYSMLAIDADRFKLINDTYGHEVGDRVLVALANSFKGCIRDGDYCARWGGEEFLALLVGADLQIAKVVAQRLLNTVRGVVIYHAGETIAPRVSIGVASHMAGEVYTDVYRRADAALLIAKQVGRDRYVIAAEEMAAEENDDAANSGGEGSADAASAAAADEAASSDGSSRP
jgi:diguanylate cyclase (GGDEF)-like protein